MNILNSSDEKIALITGSSKGLGFQIAKSLAKFGCKIIMTGRDKNVLEDACKMCSNSENHIILSGDLLEKNTLQKLFELPLIPNIIIHNVGYKSQFDEQPLKTETLVQTIMLNLGIAANINAHYLPLMQKASVGRIIHISSDVSETGKSAPGYVAAKAAINGYVKSTARFYAKYNIMLCTILPTIFSYPDSVWSIKQTTDPDQYKKRLQEMPIGRFLLAEEVAEVVSTIALTNNMSYSGSAIRLTGGV